MTRINDEGTVILCINVDDVLLIGDMKAIQLAISEIEQKFYIRKEGPLKDYLGCIINFKDKEGSIHQSHSIKRLEIKFKNLIKDIRKATVPSALGAILMRPKEGDELLYVRTGLLYYDVQTFRYL